MVRRANEGVFARGRGECVVRRANEGVSARGEVESVVRRANGGVFARGDMQIRQRPGDIGSGIVTESHHG